MEGKVYQAGEDYEKEFSPRDYLDTFYNFDSGPVAEREIIKFSLQNLHQTFSVGEWLRSSLGRGWSSANMKSLSCTFRCCRGDQPGSLASSQGPQMALYMGSGEPCFKSLQP